MHTTDGDRVSAQALLSALFPGPRKRPGIEDAIRVELLDGALRGASQPRTVADLLRVLCERSPLGEVAAELLTAVEELALRAPEQTLVDLVRTGDRAAPGCRGSTERARNGSDPS